MRERLITLACALGALLLFATLFVRGEAPDSQRSGRPTTAERRGNGLMAAMTWLQGEGIRTLSVRERFDSLAKRRDLPATGNLLIVTLPVAIPFSVTELSALERLGARRQHPAGARRTLGPARLGTLRSLVPSATCRHSPVSKCAPCAAPSSQRKRERPPIRS